MKLTADYKYYKIKLMSRFQKEVNEQFIITNLKINEQVLKWNWRADYNYKIKLTDRFQNEIDEQIIYYKRVALIVKKCCTSWLVRSINLKPNVIFGFFFSLLNFPPFCENITCFHLVYIYKRTDAESQCAGKARPECFIQMYSRRWKNCCCRFIQKIL